MAWLVFLTALTIVVDGFDNQLLGIAIPSIAQEWNVSRGAFAPVVSLGTMGMMIGAAAAGFAGDRTGRKTALIGSMAVFGCATLAVSMADSVAGLAALRLVTGIGLGGAIPNATALAAEYVSPGRRPMAVTLTIVCVPIGGVLAGLLAIPGLPALGWRGMFAAGGALPLLLAAVLTWALRESPRYLETADVREPSRTLVSADFRRDTCALWLSFFSCLLAVYLGFSWLPSILASAGLGTAAASSSLTAFNLGGVVGAIAGGALITRFGSKVTMLAMAAAAVASAAALSVTPITAQASVVAILVLLTINGGLINAVQVALYALAAHVYPTSLRARGVGAAAAVGRTGAILSGYAGPWALDRGGSAAFFALMAVAMSTALVAVAIVRRHVPGRTPARDSRSAKSLHAARE
jgi:AAHS family 4-hydroxybenzoate transporter-like MFS transporter